MNSLYGFINSESLFLEENKQNTHTLEAIKSDKKVLLNMESLTFYFEKWIASDPEDVGQSVKAALKPLMTNKKARIAIEAAK